MRFGRIDGFVWFGGGRMLLESVLALHERGVRVVVFSADRHLAEPVGDEGRTLADALAARGVPAFSSPDINQDDRLASHVTPATIGIAMGPAWIFRAGVCAMFGDRLVNFMGVDLPRYRGGAHYTWQLLHQNRTGACNMQLINPVVDSGAVIKRREYRFPDTARVPADYLAAARAVEREFLREFVAEVLADRDFPVQPLDESQAQYFPYLSTIKQGWINWEWTVHEIDRFVGAFGDPYPGASTFIDGRRVFLHDARVVESEGAFHPFTAGMIYRRRPDELWVACRGGSLAVRRVLDEQGAQIAPTLRVGHRFHTPREELDRAMAFRTVYTSGGLKTT